MVTSRDFVALALCSLLAPACATSEPVRPPVQAAPIVAKPALPTPQKVSTPARDPEMLGHALPLVEAGKAAYRNGEYDIAEKQLKQAITLYPFLAEANVLLGKIFLIRGSASRDRAMLESARLMFEMARATDPKLREAEVLLDLFRATYDQ